MERLAEMHRRPRALAIDAEVNAMVAKDAHQQIDVGKVRDIFKRQPIFGQHAGDKQRQGRILGAGNRDRAAKSLTAGNPDPIH